MQPAQDSLKDYSVYPKICNVSILNVTPSVVSQQGNGCSQFESHSLLSCFLPYITGLDFKAIHRSIQTTRLHTSHCHYCNVDFVLFHNITCYTNPLFIIHPCWHYKTPQYHVRFGCYEYDIMEFRVYSCRKQLHVVPSQTGRNS
jgi:hypothetical protein